MAECSNVVVGFDFGHAAEAALDRAVALAVRAPWHVLHVVCVIDPHAAFPALPGERIDAAYVDRVRAAIAGRIAGRAVFHVHVRVGTKPAAKILEIADDVGADLIIVGSKGVVGVERWLVGSTSERIVREAHCTVEVARDKTYAR